MQTFWLVAGVLTVSIVLLNPVAIPPSGASGPITSHPPPGVVVSPIWGPADTHIRHVITVVMENRVYDNYFGTYCQTTGPYCSDAGNGIPNGTCVPVNPSNLSLGCYAPYNLTAHQFVVPDMEHDWVSGPEAWDHGAMDDFYAAERTPITFGHYNGSTIPIYWDMAEEYATSDNFFAANLSYSLPNHWDLVAGQTPPVSSSSFIFRSTSDRATYRDEANVTPTIQDLLNRTTVDWNYYDFSLIPIGMAYANYPNGSAYDYWNPFAGRAESYSSTFVGHFVPRSDFLGDIANDSLPALSWVIPVATQSDHPGYNLTAGEQWVAQLVDAVEGSSYWNSTAIFVVWDDYGGWYDHVAPPRAMADLLSFRSPVLVISPYARENYISHVQLSFFSLLRYYEWQFGLGCLTPLDCGAALPFDFFDFNQSARAPILFPMNWTQASYPMELQPIDPTTPILCSSCTAPGPADWGNGPPYLPNPALGD